MLLRDNHQSSKSGTARATGRWPRWLGGREGTVRDYGREEGLVYLLTSSSAFPPHPHVLFISGSKILKSLSSVSGPGVCFLVIYVYHGKDELTILPALGP